MTVLKNISQLRQGKLHSDPIAHVKATQGHIANVAHHTEVTPTPDSKPHANDGPDTKLHAPVNPTAKPNTWTSGGKSQRDD
jgi:hypothetical protein